MTTHQSLALGFFIAIGLVVGVCGEHFEVTSAQQLIKLLNISEANHFDANITLLDDLDFSGSALTLPFGVSSDGSCVSYTGVFEGNGHTIKGLVMNNEDNQGYDNAGLFCGLENATFENLVIDSSCSFTGYYAGTLSVSLKGSLTVTNVTNKADISGSKGVGGFVGRIDYLSQRVEVTFKDCVNDGSVTGQSLVGGFVGKIKENEDLTMTISNCTNNGIVTGSVGYIGGFIGESEGNKVISIIISDSTNHGKVCGIDGHVGGFVGHIWGDTNMTMSIINCANNGFITGPAHIGGFTGSIYKNERIEAIISNCVNNGNITGNVTGDDADIGGFAGSIIGNVNATVTLSNFINNGNITGGSSVAGLVGMTYSTDANHSLFFTVINSANKGDVSAGYGNGCGLFCASSFMEFNVNTTVLNSINKGNVFAKAKSYGITDRITKARNVVSMGKVTGTMDSYTFWPGDYSDVDSLFGLSGCPQPFLKTITLFELNTNTGFFEVVESGEYVDALLNYESRNQVFGMVWTSELELVDKLMLDVSVSGLLTTSFLVESGTKLGDVRGLSKYLNDDKHGVVGEKSQTRVVCKETDIVSRNMSLIVGRWVNVSICAPFKDSKQMVTGETLHQVSKVFGFSLDDFVVVDTNTSEALNESWVLKTNVSLRLCHSVNVSGVDPFYTFVEHGTMLAQIEKLSGFFNKAHIVFNASNPNIVFGSDVLVKNNMDINVSKVSRQDIIVVIDDVTNVSVDDIKDAITDVIVVPDGEHVWVDVVSEGDGSYHISVIKTDGVTDSVSDLLKECLKHKS